MSKARDIASATPAPSTVSATELGYLDGVSSAIQTQIDSKIGSASAINPTIVDAKGDIIAATAADTVARLAVGSNDQVLTADSSTATGLKWATPAAGAYTLLSTTTLSGTSTTISGISGSYKDLRVVIVNCSHDGGGSPTEVYPRFRFNSDSATNYSDLCYSNNAGNGVQNQTIGATTQLRLSPAPLNNTSTTSQIVIDIFNYANTTVHKQTIVNSYLRQMENGNYAVAAIQGVWLSASAITSITFLLSANSWDNGTVYIYGVN
jgi:hypothetical protein